MAEKWAGGGRLVSRPRVLRREAVVSLDASRATAMLLGVGIAEGNCALRMREYQIRFVL